VEVLIEEGINEDDVVEDCCMRDTEAEWPFEVEELPAETRDELVLDELIPDAEGEFVGDE
jgi:hypothetical protein